MSRFSRLISPSSHARGANAPSIKTTRQLFPPPPPIPLAPVRAYALWRVVIDPISLLSMCVLFALVSVMYVGASTTMPSTAALLVLAVGALIGRVDAQGNRPWQLAVRPRYIHE